MIILTKYLLLLIKKIDTNCSMSIFQIPHNVSFHIFSFVVLFFSCYILHILAHQYFDIYHLDQILYIFLQYYLSTPYTLTPTIDLLLFLKNKYPFFHLTLFRIYIVLVQQTPLFHFYCVLY